MERISTDKVQDYEKEHIAELRRIAPECMLFLKRNGDFPLAEPGKIALFGSGARNTIAGGTGSGEVNIRHMSTVEEGLEKAGFEITTRSWLFQYDLIRRKARKPWIESLAAEAKEHGENPAVYAMGAVMPEPEYELPLRGDGDVAVYVLARISGEGSDRSRAEGDYALTGTEVRDILALYRKYPKFMLVLNTGGPVDLSPVDEVENILLMSQPGMTAGDAFADVLLGKAYPSGKLADTWAKAVDLPWIGTFGEEDDTKYREGIYVGYRYYGAVDRKPEFPFGFGLGYTDFSVNAGLKKDFSVKDGEIHITAQVKNTGKYPGREVVQLYYSLPSGKLDQPYEQLGAYAKTPELLPGEKCEVNLGLPIENMASYDEEQEAWILEKGTIILRVGTSSADNEIVGGVRFDEDVVIERETHVCGWPDAADWRPVKPDSADGGEKPDDPDTDKNTDTEGASEGDHNGAEITDDLRIISVNASDIEGRGHFDRYRKPAEDHSAEMEDYDLGIFSEEDLVRICIGKFNEKKGLGNSMIGDQGGTVPGTAGESSDVLSDNNYGKLILSDGPAGLRLAKDYILKGGVPVDAGQGVLAYSVDFLPAPVKKAVSLAEKKKAKDLENETVYHQYASAIPIGTALAQAWDPDAVEKCGDIVGNEMELFGVNVWLAPAMNIKRSPLCGRNFEYYSEDPLIAGKTAAAMTRGVQKHPKCAATIKHFACNNQEYNRTHSNSVLSERALREIYLKGFEICVKEAQPHFVMSSYNLINGRHTANNSDLLTEVLRNEWGFEGVVMTDWYTTTDIAPVKKARTYGNSVPSECIAAGNDMIEPGTRQDFDQILGALHGKDPVHPLGRKELEACVRRILYWTMHLS